MEGGNNNNNNSKREKEEIVDVRSVVEAVSANDADIAPLYQLESLCMRCHQNGITRFLLTLIPHFRKILLSAFECPHCGERNNEVQFAGEIQPRGCCYRLEVPSGDPKMLNRQVVKSESATIKIPELDFEIPPEAQRGSLSTVEGILVRAADELQALQEERKKVDPQTAEALDQFLLKLKACATGDSSFTFILDDPAGNSFIENLYAPSPDPSLSIKFYERTPDQQATLGYSVDPSQLGDHREGTSMEQISGASDEVRREPHGSVGATAAHRAIAQSNTAEIVDTVFRYTAPEEVMTFPSTCGTCGIACETRMFVTKIPYFQEVIVMASTCDACGYRNSELKPGGRVPEKGKRISLTVRNNKDLSRDVIKSDTAGVKVPELDLELASGTLGGVVTTVEGLITKISESLERVHGFTFGDSLDNHKRSKWEDFKARLDKLLSLEEPWTLILDDALANSFIAPVTEDFKDDHQLTFEEYERSWEQNEELGLNDIDTSSADGAYHSTDTTMQVKTEVTWDEPEVLHNAKRVSPWQVEVLSPTAPVHTALPPTKKFRTPQSSGQLTDGEGDLFFPFSGYTNSTMGHMSQTLLNYNTFPASMQGARQNLFSKSSLSNFISENNMCIDNSFGNNTVPKLKSVSTELNIGSSQSENLSPDSQSSMHSPFGTEFVGTQYCSSPKVGTGSFQLFGKIIHTNQPVESGFDDIGCAEDDGSKGYNETDDVNNPLDHSLNYTKLLDRLDVQCQRASAVGACNL